MTDRIGSRGLNDKQRRFADFILQGKTQIEAHKLAGYSGKNDEARAASACEILTNPNVEQYLAEQRQKASRKAEIDLTWLVEECADLYAECRTEGDRANAGANIQRLAQLTGNWLDRKETTVILHEDRLDRIRQRLNDIPAKSARLN